LNRPGRPDISGQALANAPTVFRVERRTNMKSLLPVCLAGIVLAPASGPAAANEPYEAYFAKRALACFARSYDAAHLGRHPRQKVRRIELAFRNDGKAAARAFELTLGLAPKDAKGRFAKPAHCAAEGGGFLCRVESDGGTFRLEPAGRGALALQVVGDGLRIEGAAGFVEVGGASSDDNRFVLAPAEWNSCRIAGRR
jgi:hypothetical protein